MDWGFLIGGGYVFICGEDTTQGWKPNGKPSDSSIPIQEGWKSHGKP